MLDTIKTYKPKRSKKIVRRQGGGGKLGKVLGLGGGALAGQFVSEHPIPPYLPEEVTKQLGPTKSILTELGIESAALAGAGSGAKKALQWKPIDEAIKKIGVGGLKKVLTGGLGGPLGAGYAAYGLYDLGSFFFDDEEARSMNNPITGNKYKDSKEFRKVIMDRIKQKRTQVHKRGSTKWKKERAKKKNPLFKTRKELFKKYPSIAKKLKTKNSGDQFVSKFGYD